MSCVAGSRLLWLSPLPSCRHGHVCSRAPTLGCFHASLTANSTARSAAERILELVVLFPAFSTRPTLTCGAEAAVRLVLAQERPLRAQVRVRGVWGRRGRGASAAVNLQLSGPLKQTEGAAAGVTEEKDSTKHHH